jgi:hypothetical protein
MMNAQMEDLNLESTHELENGAPILHRLQQAIENGPWILAAVSFHHLFFIVSTPASPTHDSSVRAPISPTRSRRRELTQLLLPSPSLLRSEGVQRDGARDGVVARGAGGRG